MMLYLDTSALVKLFMDEADTRLITRLLQDADAVFTHTITYAESRAALAKAVRMRRISDAMHRDYKAALEVYWKKLDLIEPHMAHIRQAGELAEIYGLRGYDSVHLAAAVWLYEQSASLTFACFDQHLNKAASMLGMEIIGSG